MQVQKKSAHTPPGFKISFSVFMMAYNYFFIQIVFPTLVQVDWSPTSLTAYVLLRYYQFCMTC